MWTHFWGFMTDVFFSLVALAAVSSLPAGQPFSPQTSLLLWLSVQWLLHGWILLRPIGLRLWSPPSPRPPPGTHTEVRGFCQRLSFGPIVAALSWSVARCVRERPRNRVTFMLDGRGHGDTLDVPLVLAEFTDDITCRLLKGQMLLSFPEDVSWLSLWRQKTEDLRQKKVRFTRAEPTESVSQNKTPEAFVVRWERARLLLRLAAAIGLQTAQTLYHQSTTREYHTKVPH